VDDGSKIGNLRAGAHIPQREKELGCQRDNAGSPAVIHSRYFQLYIDDRSYCRLDATEVQS